MIIKKNNLFLGNPLNSKKKIRATLARLFFPPLLSGDAVTYNLQVPKSYPKKSFIIFIVPWKNPKTCFNI